MRNNPNDELRAISLIAVIIVVIQVAHLYIFLLS